MSWLAREPVALFLAQVIVIVAASRLVGLLARRLGQPIVIAEIVAGIALGPSVFGALAPDAASALFPSGSLEIVRMISQLGVLLFMFLVGLELDGKLLRGRGRSSVAISISSIVIPFALGAAFALWLRARGLAGPASGVTFVLFIATAMSVTALPVLARILSERGILRTRIGTVTIACAAVDDVIAWCLLAFVVALARAGSIGPAIATTGIAIAYVGVMFFLVRPLMARIAAGGGSLRVLTQNMVAVVVVGMLLSSWATEWIGIHALFGAFLFGVITPRTEGFARSIAERLEDVVTVVLLPLFFVLSGLRTQIELLDTTDLWLTCVATIAVAGTGKLAGGAIAARLTGLSWRESGAVGILMNTRGLMELIVLNIGLDLGVISPAVFSMMVIMALVTTIMTAPVLERIYPASQMIRDLVDDQAAEPLEPKTAYRVMTCVGDPRSGPSLVNLSRQLMTDDDSLVMLHLGAPSDRASARLSDRDRSDPDLLTPLVDQARGIGVSARALSFVSARVGDDIARVAEIRRVDLVLVGMHRPVLGQTHLGGVVREVMQHTTMPVAAFVDRRLDVARRILVPFVGSPHDPAALGIARRIQRRTGAMITVLDAGDTHAALTDARGRVVVETVGADPGVVAVERAGEYDLVIAGFVKDSTLYDLIRDCPRSVLIVRGPRFAGSASLAQARVTES